MQTLLPFDAPAEPVPAEVRVRYRHQAEPAMIEPVFMNVCAGS